MNLILLAAGKGSRLSSINRLRPKVLIKINNKSILDHNKFFFDNFKKKIIISGYKSSLLKKFSDKYNFKIIHNKQYAKTNMVYSLFLANQLIDDDVVVCYGDIIFDSNIIHLLKENNNLLPVNRNWLNYWKKRMKKQNILDDAEDLIHKNNYVSSIGGRIKNRYPSSQYMGIFKLKKKIYHKLNKFFLKINNEKIDMTTFLNLSIKKIKLKMKIKFYNKYWYEIDNDKDLLIAKKELKY